MKLNRRERGRITIDKLQEISKIKVNKGRKIDSVDGCDELIKDILEEYAIRKHYLLINELNEEISLQRNKANLYKEQVDEAVEKIKKLKIKNKILILINYILVFISIIFLLLK